VIDFIEQIAAQKISKPPHIVYSSALQPDPAALPTKLSTGSVDECRGATNVPIKRSFVP
jgi:hypothetical protein